MTWTTRCCPSRSTPARQCSSQPLAGPATANARRSRSGAHALWRAAAQSRGAVIVGHQVPAAARRVGAIWQGHGGAGLVVAAPERDGVERVAIVDAGAGWKQPRQARAIDIAQVLDRAQGAIDAHV